MASNFKISTLSRNAAANGIVDQFDTGTPPGRIEIRAGTIPANVGDASGGTLLGTCLFHASNPAFGAASTGTATADTITSDTNADNSGTAEFFRAYIGAGADTAAVFQGTAGISSGTFDMEFDNATIVAGGTIAISSMTLTVPIQ